MEANRIGKIALCLAMAGEEQEQKLIAKANAQGYEVCRGRVGSMEAEKIFAAVETAAKREGIISNTYREEHALYHATLEAFHGICRGNFGVGIILRTVGLVFTVVKGPLFKGNEREGIWLAIALYGTMGAPVRGFEHEVVGLGINPI